MSVLNITNFKGGVGKTTTSCMVAYSLANKGYKVLVIDEDPQADTSDLLGRTFRVPEFEYTLYEAMEERNLQLCNISLSDNLDLCPASTSLIDLQFLLDDLTKHNPNNREQRPYFLNYMIESAKTMDGTAYKDYYDFILIDSPPTMSDYTNNAIMASDYVHIVLQSQERSLTSTKKQIEYLKRMKERYNAAFDLVGIIPVLIKKDGAVDQYVLKQAEEHFDDLMYNTLIKQRERLKRYDLTGISNKDMHDTEVHEIFSQLASEMETRMMKG